MTETIGILGGTFNPVHIGHIILATYLRQWNYVDRVWMMLSPLNPLKNGQDILPDDIRMDMLRIATADTPDIEPCDIELSLPRPSYTIDTLRTLSQRFPDKHFRLIIGSDNALIFDKWRDYRSILDRYDVIVYPRPGYPVDTAALYPQMQAVDAPIVEISSTMIREAVAAGRNIEPMLPPGVYKYISEHQLYT